MSSEMGAVLRTIRDGQAIAPTTAEVWATRMFINTVDGKQWHTLLIVDASLEETVEVAVLRQPDFWNQPEHVEVGTGFSIRLEHITAAGFTEDAWVPVYGTEGE